MSFRAQALGFSYGLADSTFELPRTGMVAVVGPNGAGKSTLVGVLAGVRRPYSGSCQYEGREIRQWPRREFAKRVAFLPQSARVEFPFTAGQVVAMGRAPHAQSWSDTTEDLSVVENAMHVTETLAFRHREFRTLSGGERQRILLAAALAQEPRVLLLDEPATFLDWKHRLAMQELLSDLARRMLVVAVTHDVAFALRYAQHVLAMRDGRIAAAGAPSAVLTHNMLASVFDVPLDAVDELLSGRLVLGS